MNEILFQRVIEVSQVGPEIWKAETSVGYVMDKTAELAVEKYLRLLGHL